MNFWSWYYSIITGLWVILIIPVELFWVVKNTYNTMSANVWRAERFIPGQPIWGWNPFHLGFIALLGFLFLYLLLHFGWGFFR